MGRRLGVTIKMKKEKISFILGVGILLCVIAGMFYITITINHEFFPIDIDSICMYPEYILITFEVPNSSIFWALADFLMPYSIENILFFAPMLIFFLGYLIGKRKPKRRGVLNER